MPKVPAVRWDHAVHYVNNLQHAIDQFAGAKLVAFLGGAHPNWGTHNALSHFGLTYLEFLGCRDEAELTQSSHMLSRDIARLLPDHQVLYRIALATDDIDATYAHLAAHKLSLTPIFDGRRQDTKGNIIAWRIFTIEGDFQGVPYPFFLQWAMSDEERLLFLKAQGYVSAHPAAAEVTMDSAILDVDQPEAVAHHWKELFFPTSAVQEKKTDAGDAVFELALPHNQRFVFTKQHAGANRLTSVQFKASPEANLSGHSFSVGDSTYRFV